MWRILAPLLLLVATLIVVAGVGLAQPADSTGTEPADSTEADVSDSSYVEPGDSVDVAVGDSTAAGERRGRGKRRAERDSVGYGLPDNWLWNTHPNYEVTISKEMDVTRWDTKISVQKQVSDKLGFNLNASTSTKENSTLNRSESNDGTTANLNYRLSDEISLGLVYNSTVLANRFNLKHREPDERRKKEDTKVSASFSKQVSDAVGIDLKAVAGATANSYADVRNEGSRRTLSGSVSFSPTDDLTSTVNYNAERLNVDSAVDSADVEVFTSDDETQRQKLSLAVGYTVIPGVNVNFNAGRSDETRQHPNPQERKQETEKRTARHVNISSSFDMIRVFTWDVDVGFDDSKRTYLVDPDKNNSSENSSLSASAKILPWRGATFSLGGERELSLGTYRAGESEKDVHRSLSLKLSQDLGKKADLSVTALSDLLSIYFDDKQANPKDRDRLKNRVSFDLNYDAFKTISTKIGGQFAEEKTIYVLKEASADNRTTRRYRVSGRYSAAAFHRVSVTQSIDISSVYTFYHFSDDRNTLVRTSNVQTRFGVPIVGGLKMNLNHSFKFQDQGGYREESGTRSYSRSAESESHRLNIGLNYNLLKHFKIFVRQTYYIQRKWDVAGDKKELENETESTEIMGRVVFNYALGERTKVSLKVEQYRKEGSRINKAFRSYRNIEFEASHVF
jgi:hypothetical protein